LLRARLQPRSHAGARGRASASASVGLVSGMVTATGKRIDGTRRCPLASPAVSRPLGVGIADAGTASPAASAAATVGVAVARPLPVLPPQAARHLRERARAGWPIPHGHASAL